MMSLSAVLDPPRRFVASSRQRAPWLDHLIRAAGRYRRDNGDRLAASLTYYAFLSFFPLLLLALSVMGFLFARDPGLQARWLKTLSDYLPGVYADLEQNFNAVLLSRRTAGVIGLVGLAWAGLGWLDAMRDALRLMWHHDVGMGNIARKKALDLVTLLGLGLTIGLSLVITGGFAASAGWALDRVGISGGGFVATAAAAVVAFAIGVVADTALFAYLFTRLPRLDRPLRTVARGAVFAAVGFGILKIAGRSYMAHFVTQGSKVFGTFAVIAGLLVWINLVSRFVLYAAAWTVTAPYDDDAMPSGTSSPAAARAAGLSEAQEQAIQEPGVPAGSVLTKEPLTGDPEPPR
jgi:membrane protein